MRERGNATWRRPIAVLALVLSLVVVAGCLGGSGSDGSASGSPSTSPSSSSPTPVETGADGLPKPVASTAWALPTETGKQSKGGGPFVRVSVYGIYRQGDAAWLYLGATIVGAGPERGIGYDYDFGRNGIFDHWENARIGEDVSGLTLLDPSAPAAYLPARDQDGKCVCSEGPGAQFTAKPIVGGSTTLIRAAFTDIPRSLDRMDVVLPRMGGLLADVPVTDRAAPDVLSSPAPSLRTPQPGEKEPPVIVPKMVSDDLRSAHSPVRRLNLPTATLDRTVTEERRRVILAADVLFAFDKATLTGRADSRIHKAATVLRKRAKGTVHVNGYTDSKGSNAYNKKLSRRRAQAVRDKLNGMLDGAGLELVAKGFGEAHPVAPNRKHGKDNPEGRKLNRRVEIRYTPKPEATPTATPPATTTPQPRPSGTPTPTKTIAKHKAQFNGSDTVVHVYRLYQHGGLVTLDFGVYVPPKSRGDGFSDQVHPGSTLYSDTYRHGASAVRLADTDHRRLYLAASYESFRDKEQCLCSQVLDTQKWDPYLGQTLYLSATYAAPPEGVDTLNVQIPQNDLSDYHDPIVLKDIPIEGR